MPANISAPYHRLISFIFASFLLLPASLATFACVLDGQSDSFDTNGERIYFTAESASGNPIYSEGFVMMHHRVACADCHGPSGTGGTIFMMHTRFETPNITWEHLTEAEDHEEHPPYTRDTVKKAITEGIDPAGEPLDQYMPRWQMSDQDLDDLVDFLTTL